MHAQLECKSSENSLLFPKLVALFMREMTIILTYSLLMLIPSVPGSVLNL